MGVKRSVVSRRSSATMQNKAKSKLKAPLKKQVKTSVDIIKLSSGAIFILPKKQVNSILLFFKGRDILSLTKINNVEGRTLAKELQSFSDKQFNELEKRLASLNMISSTQSLQYLKGNKTTHVPFEDLMQILHAVKMAKQMGYKL